MSARHDSPQHMRRLFEPKLRESAILPRGAKRLAGLSEEQFIGRVRAAVMLDCSVQLIDKLIRYNRLRAFHIGRKVIVRREDLLQLVESGEIR